MIPSLALKKGPSHDVAPLLAGITENVERDGFAFRSGSDMRSILRMRGLDAWPAFASSWDDSDWTCTWQMVAVTAEDVSPHSTPPGGAVTRKPHQPHYQSRDHNPLNGGIERWFTAGVG